jgi:hypothetical protein
MHGDMNRGKPHTLATLAVGIFIALAAALSCDALELAGLSVTPHNQSPHMRYRRAPDPKVGARVELFLRHDGPAPVTIPPDFRVLFDGRTPAELLTNGRQLAISDRAAVDGIYVVAPAPGLRQQLEARYAKLLQFERGLGFNPGAADSDFETLRQLLP